MPQSIRYRTMGVQLNKLRRHYLGFNRRIAVDYSERQLSAGAAYTVFAHGEIESFIEDWAIAILDRAAQQWASGVTSRVLVHLLTFREASSLPDKLPSKNIWSAPCVEAIANHRGLIKRNNGIKEKYICKLFVPLGFDVRNIDLILLGDLDALASIRGDHVHQSYRSHLGQKFDPFDRQTKVTNIFALLSDLDNQLSAYYATC
jgi:hypothetical protein